MDILVAFAPFVVFIILERTVDVRAGLISAAIVSIVLLIRDAINRNKTVKVLEIGTAALFGGLAIYAAMAKPNWSIPAVRLRVDGGLLLVVVVSMMIRRPFTLQYAREQAPHDGWDTPEFIHVNYVITAVWALAFAVMVSADLVMAYWPTLPPSVGIGATLLAIVGAVRFSSWYPDRQQAKPA